MNLYNLTKEVGVKWELCGRQKGGIFNFES